MVLTGLLFYILDQKASQEESMLVTVHGEVICSSINDDVTVVMKYMTLCVLAVRFLAYRNTRDTRTAQ
jgi:hypothetical protein